MKKKFLWGFICGFLLVSLWQGYDKYTSSYQDEDSEQIKCVDGKPVKYYPYYCESGLDTRICSGDVWVEQHHPLTGRIIKCGAAERRDKKENPQEYALREIGLALDEANCKKAAKLWESDTSLLAAKVNGGRNKKYPLLYYIIDNFPECMDEIFAAGVDYGSIKYNRMSPSEYAYAKRKTEVIKSMLSHKTSINEKDAEVELVVNKAIFYDDDDMIEWMLERGLSADSVSSAGYSLAERAIRGDRANIFKILLEYGADMNARTKSGETLLQCAVGFNRGNIVKLLAEHGVNINSVAKVEMPDDTEIKDPKQKAIMQIKSTETGRSPLIEAIVFKKEEMAKQLIEMGADVNVRDSSFSGRTALHAAVSNGEYEVAELLLEHGADVNARDNGNRDTPLMVAPFAAIGMAELLIERGADVNAKNKFGGTALSAAAGFESMFMKNGYVKLVKLLLENGAEVNVKDDFGYTPLKIAKEKGHDKIVELLQQYGAKE